MKNKELIAILSEMDPDAEVILQKDSEGNGYSPLEGVDNDAFYVAETTWSGTVYSTYLIAEEPCLDKETWKKDKNTHPRCIVLYPVN